MYSARSGQIGHYDQTFMQTTIQVPMYTEVSISFARQTASEGGCDRLRFFINSYEIDNWSGNVNNWATETYTYNSQENTILTLQWAYTKDGSVNSGQDACWVDDIQVTW